MSEEKADFKIGTPDEALWTQVAKEAKTLIDQSQKNLKIQSAMLELAEKNIKKEQENRKV